MKANDYFEVVSKSFCEDRSFYISAKNNAIKALRFAERVQSDVSLYRHFVSLFEQREQELSLLISEAWEVNSDVVQIREYFLKTPKFAERRHTEISSFLEKFDSLQKKYMVAL